MGTPTLGRGPSGIATQMPSVSNHKDPETRDALNDVYSAIQSLQLELATRFRCRCIFDDTVTPGQVVSLYTVSAALHARLANATTNAKPYVGFALSAVTAGNAGELVIGGICNTLSGLTPGAIYYLGLVNGTITTVKPVTVGNIVQPVGWALSATDLFFIPTLNWTQL